VDVALSRLALQGIARAATAAYHRRIAPAGSRVDGDIVFALAPMAGPDGDAGQAEMLAVEALEMAIERAVRLARGRDGVPGLAD
jgi:L-aminopeptidase/D-esterase-like protein